jgi:hypothetical protein
MNVLTSIKQKLKNAKGKAGAAVATVGAALGATAVTASAALDTTAIDTAITAAKTDIETVFAMILGAVVLIWGLLRLKSIFFK